MQIYIILCCTRVVTFPPAFFAINIHVKHQNLLPIQKIHLTYLQQYDKRHCVILQEKDVAAKKQTET